GRDVLVRLDLPERVRIETGCAECGNGLRFVLHPHLSVVACADEDDAPDACGQRERGRRPRASAQPFSDAACGGCPFEEWHEGMCISFYYSRKDGGLERGFRMKND